VRWISGWRYTGNFRTSRPNANVGIPRRSPRLLPDERTVELATESSHGRTPARQDNLGASRKPTNSTVRQCSGRDLRLVCHPTRALTFLAAVGIVAAGRWRYVPDARKRSLSAPLGFTASTP
jgi:hypothetical protein